HSQVTKMCSCSVRSRSRRTRAPIVGKNVVPGVYAIWCVPSRMTEWFDDLCPYKIDLIALDTYSARRNVQISKITHSPEHVVSAEKIRDRDSSVIKTPRVAVPLAACISPQRRTSSIIPNERREHRAPLRIKNSAIQ